MSSPRNRTISYEVMLCEGKRWTIDSLIEDERQAIQRARSLLARGGCEAVKVTRHRSRSNGMAVKQEIFHEHKRLPRNAPIGLSSDGQEAPFCQAPCDLYRLDSRMAIGALLRSYLTQHAITPSELLHDLKLYKRLEREGPLLGAAIYKVAQVQAKVSEEPTKDRQTALECFLDTAVKQARALGAAKAELPPIAEVGSAEASLLIRERFGEEIHDRLFLALLSDHLMGARSLAGKFEMTLALLAMNEEPWVEPLIEGVLADCLGFAEVIKEIFPEQRSLADFLSLLADVLRGQVPGKGQEAFPSLAAIGLLLRAERAPACRTVLLERLHRELESGKPLYRHNPAAEGRVLEELRAHLREIDGSWLGGERSRDALESRRLRQRQDTLRRFGLEASAEAVPARSGR